MAKNKHQTETAAPPPVDRMVRPALVPVRATRPGHVYFGHREEFAVRPGRLAALRNQVEKI